MTSSFPDLLDDGGDAGVFRMELPSELAGHDGIAGIAGRCVDGVHGTRAEWRDAAKSVRDASERRACCKKIKKRKEKTTHLALKTWTPGGWRQWCGGTVAMKS